MKNQMAQMMKVSSDYCEVRKQEMINFVSGAGGFAREQVKAFLDTVGTASHDPEEVLGAMRLGQNYVNKMK